MQALLRDGDRGDSHVDAAGLDRREEAVKRRVDEFDGLAEALGDFVDEIDFEARDLAAGIFEFPWNVADIGPDRQICGLYVEHTER